MAILARISDSDVKAKTADSEPFRMPSASNVFMIVAFAWSALCFFMVVGGNRIAGKLAMLSGSDAVRQLFLTEQTAIAGFMLIGLIAIAAGFAFFERFKTVTTMLVYLGFSFASSLWAPLHDAAFALKYATFIYLGTFGALFFIHNGWRLINLPGYRIMLVYLGWLALITAVFGFTLTDIWYLSTEVVLIVGFSMAWLNCYTSHEKIANFNKIFAYTGVVVTFIHLMSPFLYAEYSMEGRFVSYFNRATGFATIFSLFVVAVFWLSMIEKRRWYRLAFLGIAMAGYGLILWSGTRSATVAAILAVGILWWVFRSRIFVLMAFVGVAGFLVQLILGSSEDLSYLTERLQRTDDNSRFDVWAIYWDLLWKSPFIGYGPNGLPSAYYGETLVGVLSNQQKVYAPAVHNWYLGFTVRYGLLGGGIMLLMLYVSFRDATRVIFSRAVPLEEKKIYILPVALLAVVAMQGLVEDTIMDVGKGTLHGVVFAVSIPILIIYGRQLLRVANEPAEHENN